MHPSLSTEPDLDLECSTEQGDRDGGKKEWEWREFKNAKSLPHRTLGSLKKKKKDLRSDTFAISPKPNHQNGTLSL